MFYSFKSVTKYFNGTSERHFRRKVAFDAKDSAVKFFKKNDTFLKLNITEELFEEDCLQEIIEESVINYEINYDKVFMEELEMDDESIDTKTEATSSSNERNPNELKNKIIKFILKHGISE